MLDRVIACAFLGKDEMALTSMNKLESLFLSSENLCNRNKNIHKRVSHVYGPDQEPYSGWCSQAVDSTYQLLCGLIGKSSLSFATQQSIIFTLSQVKNLAMQCCLRGGMWKGCVEPLAKKLVEWEAFGVPPNPAWD